MIRGPGHFICAIQSEVFAYTKCIRSSSTPAFDFYRLMPCANLHLKTIPKYLSLYHYVVIIYKSISNFEFWLCYNG